MSEELLDLAIELAKKYHKDQFDKGGNPYINHPLAVMNRLDTAEEKIVGVLHDIIEDTELTFDDLREYGFSEKIIAGIDSVTRREGEEREAFIYRAKLNELGRTVKIADLKENRDLSRIPNPQEKDYQRAEKYEREIRILTEDNWIYSDDEWIEILEEK
ncbi:MULTISPECIES: bifunctional (p)ppGpp synthetase/guanosine-3',5'-bis(diphosphate) 3'-pyrophosphohydrolase [unclassified Bacillus (in: firmicutes)]|uniref:bifunctional (p)ppGpp synthetase/guanosine-3',5'-bis(diphosphate) 3'-pyrophosphohydrolase n=1 Tax=unclassified Bacillus (in: firmicutes) TaxID=185979 RepID=UPI001123C156|nr:MULTISPECIES: bifunctional (p)ppGpp synthetase/guanosine-3',5'-bis(diphosphate) 3'-pyrophosphohydrolase [unclassified Bacillus (in: firmicutes)]